jgi:hypothetical protein
MGVGDEPLGSSLHLFEHNQDYLSGSLNDPSGNLKLCVEIHFARP